MTDAWKPDVVIYHDPCLDGFTAAWAAWKRWPEAEFAGCNYGRPAPDVVGKNVLIVDFSFKRADLDALAQVAKSIIILDHHKSAQADLAAFAFTESSPGVIVVGDVSGMLRDLDELNRPPVFAIFDMERSGARMTWDFCRLASEPREAVPPLVLLVEDRDLWRFEYGDLSRDLQLRLSIEPKTFEGWDRLDRQMPGLASAAASEPVADGAAMRRYRDFLARSIAEKAEMREIGGHLVPVVDCPYELASEVGELLCSVHTDAPFSAMRVHSGAGTSFSLRSRGGFDCSALAAKFGGGGHAGAAGFRVPPSL